LCKSAPIWSITSAVTSSDTIINSITGVLTIGLDETATSITIKVEDGCGLGVYDTVTIPIRRNFVITSSSGSGGSISPNGNVNVTEGGS